MAPVCSVSDALQGVNIEINEIPMRKKDPGYIGFRRILSGAD